jgi:hypothetical protein
LSIPEPPTAVEARALQIIEFFPNEWKAMIEENVDRMLGPLEAVIGRDHTIRDPMRDVLTRVFAVGFATGEASEHRAE